MASHTRKTPPDPNLALRIRYQLLRLGRTAAWLARELEVTPGAVSHWTNERGIPDPAMLPKVAEKLNTTVEWLMGYGLTDEQRQREARKIQTLLAVTEGALEDVAAAFLAEVERAGGLEAATQALQSARGYSQVPDPKGESD